MAGQPPPPPPVQKLWLFKKKLNSTDVATVMSHVLIEECCEEMKTVLKYLVEVARGPFQLRIMAEDPMEDSYELDFGYYVGGDYVVYRQWGDVVTSNSLREGDTVECWGNFVGDNEIRATLYIDREIQDSKVKVPLKLPIIPTADGGKKPAPETLGLLFEKKLDDVDVDPFLGELVLTRCHKKLKKALEETPRIMVSTAVDPNNEVEQTRLMFMRYRYVNEERYSLCHAWRQVVADNGLKEGEWVIGYGNDVSCEEFGVKLYVLRDNPPPSDVNKDEEGRKDDYEGQVTTLLFKKDPAAVIGRVVIETTRTELAEAMTSSEWEMEGWDEDEGGNVFARFSVEGANGVKYEWREEADEDGSSKSVGGAVVEDGEVRMKIDVYKSR